MVERHRDDWIAERLKAEADRYEPDLDRIRARISDHRGDHPARRSTWLLPAAAATFVILTAGAITAVYSEQTSGPDDRVNVVGPARPGGDLPAASSSAIPPVPSPSASPSPPTAPATTPGPSVTTGDSAEAGSPAAPRAVVELDLAAIEPGRAVTLPGGSADWIAAGSEAADQTVRRTPGEQTISGPHETGTASSTTTKSPFAVSWTGGMAEASHRRSRAWRTVSGPIGGPDTGLILRVPAEKRTATFTLYVGAGGADAELRTKLGSKTRTTRLKAAADGGYVATIRFHADHAGDELTVELIGGSGGSISFAAAALR